MARRPSTSTLGFVAVVALAVLGGWILVTSDGPAGARHDALRVPGLLHVEPARGRRRVEPGRLRQRVVLRPVPGPHRRSDRRDLSAEYPGGVAPRDPDRVPRHRGRPADLAGGRPRLDRGDDRGPHRRPPGPSIAAPDPGRHRPVPLVGSIAGDGLARAGVCADARAPGGRAVGGRPWAGVHGGRGGRGCRGGQARGRSRLAAPGRPGLVPERRGRHRHRGRSSPG